MFETKPFRSVLLNKARQYGCTSYIVRQSDDLDRDQAARVHSTHCMPVYNLVSSWTARMRTYNICLKKRSSSEYTARATSNSPRYIMLAVSTDINHTARIRVTDASVSK